MTTNKILLVGSRRFALLVATVVLLLSAVGCISEKPYTAFDDVERAVTLRIVQADAATNQSRSVSTPIGDPEPVEFNTGYVFLVTATGVIERYIVITDAPVATPITATHIPRYRLDAGAPLAGALVPGNVHEAVIVGNTTLPTNVREAAHISAVLHHTINITGQTDARDPGINLFGRAPLTNHNTTPATASVTVTPRPTVARFEIHQITAGTGIYSFQVAGIFIDNHYGRARIDGFIPEQYGGAGNRISRGDNSGAFASGQDFFTGGTYGALFSEYDGNWSGSPTQMPHNGVWSYHVFAQSYGHVRGIQPPRIVIRLSNVVLGDGTDNSALPGYHYVTVTNFAKSGTPLSTINARTVYRIENLTFEKNHISPRPNQRDINVNVTVTLHEWNRRVVTNGGFRTPSPVNAEFNGVTHTFNVGAAVHGNCVGSIAYLWQRSTDGTAWTPDIPFSQPHALTAAAFHTARAFPGNAPYINQNLTVGGVGGASVSETTYFRRVALMAACNAFVVSRAAELEVNMLPTPGIVVSAPAPHNADNPTRFPNFIRFRVTRPATGWTNEQWAAFAATNLTVTRAGVVIQAADRPLTGTGNTRYFTVRAITRTDQEVSVNFTGDITALVDGVTTTVRILPRPAAYANTVFLHCAQIGTACWAFYNLDVYNRFVTNMWERGNFFQWGSRVAWSATAPLRRWNVGETAWLASNWVILGGSAGTWEPEKHDPCPNGWRMPTFPEIAHLVRGDWTSNWNDGGTMRGAGWLVPHGAGYVVGYNAIFMPAGGRRRHGDGVLEFNSGNGIRGFYAGNALWWWAGEWHAYAPVTLELRGGSGDRFLTHLHLQATGELIRCVVDW